MKNKPSKFWPSKFPRHLSIPETTVQYNLEISAARYPYKSAVVFYDNIISYHQLATEAKAIAGYLQKKCNIKKGDRVLLDLQNSPQFVIGYFGILLAGGVIVPVSPMNITEELAHYFQDSGAETAIIGQELFKEFKPLLGKVVKNIVVANYKDYLVKKNNITLPEQLMKETLSFTSPNIHVWKDVLAQQLRPNQKDDKPDDLAAILYTSGTTGKPKGCMHTHKTIMVTLVGGAVWKELNQDSVSLATAPMFHVTGMQHSLNAVVYTGGTMVILPRWNPGVAGYMIEKYRCTHWANVPTMVVDLLADPSTKDRDLSSLTDIFGGGSAMPEAVAKALYERCGIEFIEGYGMTETISQTHMNPNNEARKQCLGIPTFDTESIILDPESMEIQPENKLGEILVSGPQIMVGYWNRPEANEEIFVKINGRRYLRTGDLGYMDSDGFFYIADRLKRMINAAGFKVWPAELEATLYKLPEIKEVAIISTPDSRKGENVKAVIALKKHSIGKISKEDVITWCKKNMAAYKVPKLVDFVNELPRSGAGKIQWRTLQELEWNNNKINN